MQHEEGYHYPKPAAGRPNALAQAKPAPDVIVRALEHLNAYAADLDAAGQTLNAGTVRTAVKRATAQLAELRQAVKALTAAADLADIALDADCEWICKRISPIERGKNCPRIQPGIAANCSDCRNSKAMAALRAARAKVRP